jgi:hypothetical protein
MRLEEKKAILERMENPPVPVLTKPDRKGKQQKKPGAQTVRTKLEQEPEKLPYLPTPDEIILQREGIFFKFERIFNKHINTFFKLINKFIILKYVKNRIKIYIEINSTRSKKH